MAEPEIIVDLGDDVILDTASDSPEDNIGDLKRQLEEIARERDSAREESNRNRMIADEAERRRQDAEIRAEQSRAVSKNAQDVAIDREYDSINSSILGATARIDSLTADFVKAQEAGDVALMAKINVQLGREGAKLEGLEQNKSNLESKRQQREQNPPAPAPRAPQESQQAFFQRSWSPQEFETVMRSYSPATAAWMRQNPRYASDPSFRSQVNSAHAFIVSKGVSPDSDTYFREIDSMVGNRQPEPAAPAPQPATSYSPRGAQVAAPVSRSVPTGNQSNGSPTRVKLSQEQREIARIMFANDADPETKYAKYLVQDQRDGRTPFPGRSF